jgi:hypothetical protein
MSAEKEVDYIRSRLAVLEEAIKGYKLFLGPTESKSECADSSKSLFVYRVTLPGHCDETLESNDERYDPNWTQTAKILYVLKQPERYGKNTFVGAGDVVNALREEEPDLEKEDNSNLLKRFGPALSRMVQNHEVVRAVEIDNKARVHYLSPEWFDNGRPLLKYYSRVSHLQVTHKGQHVLPKKTAAASTAAEPGPN